MILKALALHSQVHILPVPLRHAAVVDHEEVDLEGVSASAPDVVVLSAYEVDHLDTASLALPGGWHCTLQSLCHCTKYTCKYCIL